MQRRSLSRLVALLSDPAAFCSSEELLGLLRSEAPRGLTTAHTQTAAQPASPFLQHLRCLSTSSHSYSEPRAAYSPASTSQLDELDDEPQHAALRHISIAQLPPEYKAALHRCIASSGANAREVRIMVNHLKSKAADLEKHLLSLIPPVQAYNGQQQGTPRTASGRVTKQALHEASIALEHEGAQAMDPEVFNKLLGLPSPSSTTNRGKVEQGQRKSMRGARPKPPIEYNEQQAIAAAAASSSAWFATSLRVLHELKSADPSFRPTSMLDYGAGFGGVVQAAQQVWPSQVRNVTAVERSPAMLHMGASHSRTPPCATNTASNAAKAAWPSSAPQVPPSASASSTSPRVTWVRGLPKLPGKDAASVVQPKYNLVVGAYILSEETLPQERLQLVDQLWGHTSDMLVLVEHGTRLGSSIILEARNRILDREARKVARHQQHHHQQRQDASTRTGGASQQNGGGTDGRGMGRAWPSGAAATPALPVGAHVVAPCPHDGRCPLEGNPRSFCHFEQRYEPPDFMRNTIGRGKDGITIPSSMGAHFCYVILRRGPRPSGPPSHLAAPSLHPALKGQAPEPSFTKEELWQEIQRERLTTQNGLEPSDASDTSRTVGTPRQRQPLFSTQGGEMAAGEGFERAVEAARHALFERAREQGQDGDLSRAREMGGNSSADDEERHGSSSRDEEPEQRGLLQMEAFEQRYPAHARGLVDRLMALEHAGLSWSKDPEGGLDREAAATAMSLPLDDTGAEEEGEAEEEMSDWDPMNFDTGGEDIRKIEETLQNEMTDQEYADEELGADSHTLPPDQQQQHGAPLDASSGQGIREGEGGDTAAEAEGGEHEQGEHSGRSAMDAAASQGPVPFGGALFDAAPAEVERAVQRLQQRHSAQQGATVHGLTCGGAGMPWPRIYRQPLKRGGHVVLDLCVPAGPGGEGGGVASQGRLERQVISRAKAGQLHNRNAYKLAREVSWGDLWPADYLAKSRDS